MNTNSQHNEDEALRALFANFNPPMQSSTDFMRCLDNKLNSVEIIKQRYAMERRRSKRAVVISGICGMVTGILLSAIFPSICRLFLSVLDILRYSGDFPIADIVTWAVIAAASVGVAGAGYNLSEVFIKHQQPQ